MNRLRAHERRSDLGSAPKLGESKKIAPPHGCAARVQMGFGQLGPYRVVSVNGRRASLVAEPEAGRNRKAVLNNQPLLTLKRYIESPETLPGIHTIRQARNGAARTWTKRTRMISGTARTRSGERRERKWILSIRSSATWFRWWNRPK